MALLENASLLAEREIIFNRWPSQERGDFKNKSRVASIQATPAISRKLKDTRLSVNAPRQV
jgi:hypothetical protein